MPENLNNYCSLDSILMEEEKLPSYFLSPVFNLGSLDPGNSKTDIPEETKVELPYWLAKKLKKFKIIDIEYPPAYERKRLNNLKISPLHEALGQFPYFFELGVKLSKRFLTDIFFLNNKLK